MEENALSTGLGFVDQILECGDDRITAQKNLSINEDYLLDHFPDLPVMPGVLMIQAAVEAAGWWLKQRLDFTVSGICLEKLQMAKFANFLRPGESLTLEVQNLKLGEGKAEFQARGRREETVVLSLRFTVNYQRLDEVLESGKAKRWKESERANFNTLFRSEQRIHTGFS